MHPDVGRPLAVDLDGTLISTDLLVETASAYATSTPLGAFRIVRWLAAGRDRAKIELATRVPIDPATLPYRADVLNWLRAQHDAGRRLLLVSAADERQVGSIAAYLGIFDAHFGTRAGHNLKAHLKHDLLVDEFGQQGYDYIGNHRDDAAVWSDAHTAHVVGGARLAERARRSATVGVTFPTREDGGRPHRLLLKAMRPHQWTKNILVAVPLASAQLLHDAHAVLSTLLAFVLFSVVSSGVYLLNDIIDVPHDRAHPTKRHRPFAAGRLSQSMGWIAWPILTTVAFASALILLPWEFSAVLAAYFMLTLTYSLWAKRRAILDVVTLGCLYTIRLVAGGAAIDVPLSIWLITFSMLFFLSLALIKRVSELTRVRRTGTVAHGRGYYDSDLELLSSYGVASSIGSVVIFALYLQDAHTQHMYASPSILGLAIPILLAWLMRSWLWAHRGDMAEDPIVFAARDTKSMLLGAAFIAVFLVANVLHT